MPTTMPTTDRDGTPGGGKIDFLVGDGIFSRREERADIFLTGVNLMFTHSVLPL